MSRRRTKEGYLSVKQSGRSAFGKSWKRKWVVVHPNNTRSQVGELAAPSLLLELYVEKGNHGKTVNSVLVEDATSVSRVLSKSQPLSFEVRNNDNVLFTAAGESETESQEWMTMFRQQLLVIRQKELSRLPDASEDAYRVSIIPNKYSEALKMSGDLLAHVTSMTFGVYGLYNGKLVKEWDLRHTKRFSLQSKGPTKDVDRIAVIQISSRSPHGDGNLLLYSLNAKAFLEKIYENLNSAIDMKSKRTRTSSMLFEIPPKELEALGREIKEVKTPNGAEENGSAQKGDLKADETDAASTQTKEQADAGTQLSEQGDAEDIVFEQEKVDKTADELVNEEEKDESTKTEEADSSKDTVADGEAVKKDETSNIEEKEKVEVGKASTEEQDDGKSSEAKYSQDQAAAEVTTVDAKSKENEPTLNEIQNEGKEVAEKSEKDEGENNTQEAEVEVHAPAGMSTDTEQVQEVKTAEGKEDSEKREEEEVNTETQANANETAQSVVQTIEEREKPEEGANEATNDTSTTVDDGNKKDEAKEGNTEEAIVIEETGNTDHKGSDDQKVEHEDNADSVATSQETDAEQANADDTEEGDPQVIENKDEIKEDESGSSHQEATVEDNSADVISSETNKCEGEAPNEVNVHTGQTKVPSSETNELTDAVQSETIEESSSPDQQGDGDKDDGSKDKETLDDSTKSSKENEDVDESDRT